jgi:hypothetical protein
VKGRAAKEEHASEQKGESKEEHGDDDSLAPIASKDKD